MSATASDTCVSPIEGLHVICNACAHLRSGVKAEESDAVSRAIPDDIAFGTYDHRQY
jgi:hypothetical protein